MHRKCGGEGAGNASDKTATLCPELATVMAKLFNTRYRLQTQNAADAIFLGLNPCSNIQNRKPVCWTLCVWLPDCLSMVPCHILNWRTLLPLEDFRGMLKKLQGGLVMLKILKVSVQKTMSTRHRPVPRATSFKVIIERCPLVIQ